MKLSHYPLKFSVLFFFKATAATDIYTLSLHDALPIFVTMRWVQTAGLGLPVATYAVRASVHPIAATSEGGPDRKSTRLNSSHVEISYAVFCLKKKKKKYAPAYNVHSFADKYPAWFVCA